MFLLIRVFVVIVGRQPTDLPMFCLHSDSDLFSCLDICREYSIGQEWFPVLSDGAPNSSGAPIGASVVDILGDTGLLVLQNSDFRFDQESEFLDYSEISKAINGDRRTCTTPFFSSTEENFASSLLNVEGDSKDIVLGTFDGDGHFNDLSNSASDLDDNWGDAEASIVAAAPAAAPNFADADHSMRSEISAATLCASDVAGEVNAQRENAGVAAHAQPQRPRKALVQRQHEPATASQRAKRQWDAASADAAVAVAPKRGRGQRGAHVRERPDMQQVAREGAAHWQQRLQHVRTEWAAAAQADPEGFGAQYRPQVEAAAGRVKAKLECLLRTLQLAAHRGAILPAAAAGAGVFFGWDGFVVAAGRAGEWREAVEGLFPAGFREETVRETFRKAGLVPAGWRWDQGWRGEAPFVPVVRRGLGTD